MTDIFDEKNEMKPQSVDWQKVGDNIVGTLIDVRNNLKTAFGLNTLYEIRAKSGFFHVKDSNTKVEIKEGDIWGVWGRGDIFNGQMRRIKIGQKVGLKFTETQPSSMGNPAKIIKVFNDGTMDDDWLAQQAQQEVTAADLDDIAV